MERLSGDADLVVIHALRLMRATSLLRTWLDTSAPTGAVVSCVLAPPADIGEDGYWGLLAAELSRGAGEAGGDDGDDDEVGAFPTVLRRLAALDRPAVLVLDDLHLVECAAAYVDQLFDHAPAGGLRIIAATRTERDRRGQISRLPSRRFISPGELAYGPEDIAELLRHRGTDFDVRTPEIVHRLTDGVPALVEGAIATVPIQQLAAPEHLAEHLPAAIDLVVDREIREDPLLSARRREVLLAAAADPLTPEVIPLLAGPDAATFTRLLDNEGLALVTGGPVSQVWVLPEPVRSSLLRLAQAEYPDALREFRTRLIELWLEADNPNNALKVAADMEDWQRVIEVMRAHVGVLFTRDYPTSMGDQIITRVPEELLADAPVLRRLRSMIIRFETPRDLPLSDPDQRGSEEGAVTGPDDDPESVVMRALELRVKGRFAESAAVCDPLMALPPTVPETLPRDERDKRAFGLAHIGNCYLLAGRFADAISVLRRSFRTAPESSFILRDAAGKLALTYAVIGQIREAQGWLEEERRHPALPPGTEELVRPAGDVAAALLAIERLDAEAAAAVLDDLGPPADREEFWGFILYAGAQVALLHGTPVDGIRALTSDLPRFATMREHGAVAGPLLDAMLADLHLACGETRQAVELVGRSTHPLTAPARARTLLLTGRPEAALSCADQGLADLRTTTRGATELRLVAAAAALELGTPEAARRHLTHAVATHRSTGLMLPFASLPADIVQVLAELEPAWPGAAHPASWENVGVHPPPQEPPARPTARELAILHELATGATNRQIAQRNHVTVNTVKTQLKSAFRKLGVTSREDAVEAARRHGWL